MDNQDTPTAIDNLSPADKGLYAAIETSFKEDPTSIPEKFHKADNPVLAYMESYKQLERKLHSKADEEGEKEEEKPTEEEVDTTLPETVDFDLPPEPARVDKSFSWARLETARNGGVLTPEVKKYLSEDLKMAKADLDAFVGTIKTEIQAEVAKAAELVGGVENLKELNQWVLKNKTRDEIQRINSALHDETTRRLTLLGLMAESNIVSKVNKTTVKTTTVDANGDGAVPYESNAELQQDLRHPALKNRWHPDHEMMRRKIDARIRATRPGILM